MALPERREIAAPMVIRPFDEYRSTITGEIISDRRGRREELAIAADRNLVPWEPKSGMQYGLINERFARRAGKVVDEAASEWAQKEREKARIERAADGGIIVR